MLPSKKRKRVIKACEFCRRRKIKCNRESPCSGCAKYGRVCQYLDLEWETKEEEGSDSEKSKKKISNSPTGNFGEVYDELNSLKQKLYLLEKSVERSANDQKVPEYKFEDTCELDDLLGKNPFDNIEEAISFYDGYTSITLREPIRQRHFGPLTWFAIIKRDVAIRKVWDFMLFLNVSTQDKIRLFRTTIESPQMERAFSEKVVNDEGLNELKLFKDSKSAKASPTLETGSTISTHASSIPIYSPKPPLSRNPTSYWVDPAPSKLDLLEIPEKEDEIPAVMESLFYQSRFDEQMHLIERIKKVLPKKKVVWLLFNRFFSNVYPFIPFVDEEMLLDDLDKLIDLKSFETAGDDEVIEEIKVERKLDFAHLGILLLVLRFGHLTIAPNLGFTSRPTCGSDNCQEIEYLLQNPVEINVADTSQICLSQFNLMRSGNLTIMQLALLTRFYHMYAPEDGEGTDGGDSQVFNSMLIQMAYALGLHRDPDRVPEALKNEKMNNLSRKIWYSLVISDLTGSISHGTHLTISKQCYDTKLPYLTKDNSNIKDLKLEQLTINSFHLYAESFDLLREIIALVLDLSESVKMGTLIGKMNTFETRFLSNFKALKSELLAIRGSPSPHEIFPLIFKVKLYTALIFFMIGIYVFILNYYENKKNKLSFYYMKKIILITGQEFMSFYFELQEKNSTLFRNATDLVLVPAFQSTCHKSIIFISSLFLRTKFELETMKTKAEHAPRLLNDPNYKMYFDLLIRLTNSTSKCTVKFRTLVARLSHKYYYSWRVTKAQNYISQVIVLEEFYEKCKKEVDFTMGYEELIVLNDIMENSLRNIQPDYDDAYSTGKTVPKHEGSVYTPTITNTMPQCNWNDSDSQYVNDDQIDKLWTQMMSLKKDTEVRRAFGSDIKANPGVNLNFANSNNQMYFNPTYATPESFNFNSSIPSVFQDQSMLGVNGGYAYPNSNVEQSFPEESNQNLIGYDFMSSFNMAPDDIFRDFT